MNEPNFYRAITEAIEEAKSTPPSREYVQSQIELCTKVSTNQITVMADGLIGTLQAMLELIESKDNPTVRMDNVTKRIYAGKCELVDYPDVEKIKLKNGYGKTITLTYETAMEVLAVLDRWHKMQVWKNIPSS